MCVVISSCAQPPPPKKYVRNYNHDVVSRTELNVAYEAPDTMALYFKNPKGTQVWLWLILNHSVPEERITRETLVYQGTEKSLHKLYRLPQGTDGIEGSLYVRALNLDGQELIRSKAIILHQKENK